MCIGMCTSVCMHSKFYHFSFFNLINQALHLFFFFCLFVLFLANMHSRKPTITPWAWIISYTFLRILQILGPFFSSMLFYFYFSQRFVQEFLGFECPCRRNISLKHKPLTLVDSIRTCLRHGMHSELWLTCRGPTCAHLFVIHPQCLADGLGGG